MAPTTAQRRQARALHHAASCAGTCVSASAAFIRSAPRKIMKIIAEAFGRGQEALRKLPQVISRLASAATKVAAAPTAAPSVGVNLPP
jgi:hypothetical protein